MITYTLADVDIDDEPQLIQQRQANEEEYHRFIAQWNQRVSSAEAGTKYDFAAFCEFLISAYDALLEDRMGGKQ